MEISIPIKREQDLSDIAYERIKEMILDTVLKPGEVIFTPKLARIFQVSRTPVREALARLKQEGWIISTDGQGFLVSPLTPTDINEIFETSLFLEPPAIKLFTEVASDQLLNELWDPTEKIESQIVKGEFELYFDIHMKLHNSYIHNCPNNILKDFLIHVNDLMNRLRIYTRSEPSRHVLVAYKEHKQIKIGRAHV